MKKIILALGLFLILALSGCGYKEGAVTISQKSYLFFTGNVTNTKVSIDGGEKFNVLAGQNNQYSVKPGKHLVEVYRDGEIVVKREIYLGDDIAKEIEIR
jgi:hypothetical protein